jgi:hypothetical protein
MTAALQLTPATQTQTLNALQTAVALQECVGHCAEQLKLLGCFDPQTA